jgi:hypothetical protein
MIKFSSGKKESFIVGGVRGNKHPLDARIYSYNRPFLDKFRDFFFIAKNQIKFIFNLFKFRVLPSIGRDIRMMQGNALTPKGNAFPGFVEVPFPDQRKCGIFKDGQFPSFVGPGGLISGSNVLADTASKLTGKMKFFTKGRIIGLGQAIGIHFFRIESQRRQPIQGLEVVFNYFWGLGRAFNFDFSGAENFHCKDPLVSVQ